MAYTPPACGSAEFYIGEARNHGCTGIVFYLGDGYLNSVVISDNLDIQIYLNTLTIAHVFPTENPNTAIDISLPEIGVKSHSQFANMAGLSANLDLSALDMYSINKKTLIEDLGQEVDLSELSFPPIHYSVNQEDLGIDLDLSELEVVLPYHMANIDGLGQTVDLSELSLLGTHNGVTFDGLGQAVDLYNIDLLSPSILSVTVSTLGQEVGAGSVGDKLSNLSITITDLGIEVELGEVDTKNSTLPITLYPLGQEVGVDTVSVEWDVILPINFETLSAQIEGSGVIVEWSAVPLSVSLETLYPLVGLGIGGLAEGPLFPPSVLKSGGYNPNGGIVWGIAIPQDRSVNMTWAVPEIKDVQVDINWAATSPTEFKDVYYYISWANFLPQDIQRNSRWSELNVFSDSQFNIRWSGVLTFIDISKSIPWGDIEACDVQVNVPYLQPPPKDHSVNIPWRGEFDHRPAKRVNLPFTVTIPFKDTQRNIRWGPRDLTWGICEPGSLFDKPTCRTNRFRLEEDITGIVGICQDVIMVLQCDNRAYNPYNYHHTGNRDNGWIPPLGYGPNLPIYGENYYIVENTILIRRLSDNAPIDVTAVSCRIDKGSWLWDFSLTVPTSAFRDLMKPYKNGDDTYFHDIEISINQNIWTCRIEDWAESRVFGKDGWTLTGRSPSSELTEPFSIPESFLSEVIRQGGETIDEILDGTGWVSQWGYADNITTYSDYINPYVDWLIPADGYSYTDLTKKSGVQDVIQAIGGFAQTKAECHLPADKKIILNPNYVRDPWRWVLLTPDVSIPEALCKEISRSFTTYKRTDAVIVCGIDHGVIVNATRDLLAGTTYAPMVAHALISTVEAGSERARSELAKTGMWSTHTLNLFSLKVPGSGTDPTARLILPGELVQLTERGVPWRGQASATTVTATVSDQGVKDVMQTIQVEEFLG